MKENLDCLSDAGAQPKLFSNFLYLVGDWIIVYFYL